MQLRHRCSEHVCARAAIGPLRCFNRVAARIVTALASHELRYLMGIPELIPGDFLEHLGPVGVAIVLGSTRETIYLFESFVATARNTVHYLAKVHDLAHRLTCFINELRI